MKNTFCEATFGLSSHCQYFLRFQAKELTVSLADHDRESADRTSEVVVRGIRKIMKHEGFDSRTFNNDIAVLEMDNPVQFGAHIQPACLPDTGR